MRVFLVETEHICLKDLMKETLGLFQELGVFWSGRVFVTAASFLNIAAKTGIVNLSEIYYYEILANEHHRISP